MLKLGLGLGLGKIQLLGAGLDFSELTALPAGRRSAVTTAANTAATTLDVEPQSVIDALAAGRGLASLLPNDGCLLAASGGAATAQGDPVGAIRSWTGIELAVQTDASLRPVSAGDGIFADGAKSMILGNLSSWTAGEGLVVSQASQNGVFWEVGIQSANAHQELIPWTLNRIFVNFGQNQAREQVNTTLANIGNKFIYNPRASSGSRTIWLNGLEVTSSITIGFSSNARMLRGFANSTFHIGTWSALALSSDLYTASQRSAVREFCRNYYGVSY